jgi:hypothetical protein
MARTRSSIIGLVAVGVLALGACGSDDDSSDATTPGAAASAAPTGSDAAAPAVSGSLDAADQTSDGSTLSVSTVSITGASGFIAIHADADGAPGPVVGHVAIPEGDSTDVSIPFDATAATGAYWPMLHLDAGTVGTYEFPGPDGPVKSGSDIVMKKITLTVG